MRLLIPTTDANGPSARMSGHFGRAPYYTLADTETGVAVSIANPAFARRAGDGALASEAELESYDAVVCQGIGESAMMRLAQAGVPVFVHEGPDVATAVTAFKGQTLRMADEYDGCGCAGSCGCGGHGGGQHH